MEHDLETDLPLAVFYCFGMRFKPLSSGFYSSILFSDLPDFQFFIPPPPFGYRFTKNLSPDKINLSTLKGQGQLTNLELDEEVLQNVLELPTWLAITRVFCNKASIRVS